MNWRESRHLGPPAPVGWLCTPACGRVRGRRSLKDARGQPAPSRQGQDSGSRWPLRWGQGKSIQVTSGRTRTLMEDQPWGGGGQPSALVRAVCRDPRRCGSKGEQEGRTALEAGQSECRRLARAHLARPAVQRNRQQWAAAAAVSRGWAEPGASNMRMHRGGQGRPQTSIPDEEDGAPAHTGVRVAAARQARGVGTGCVCTVTPWSDV